MAAAEDDTAALRDVPKAALLAWGVTSGTTKGPKPRWTLEQILDTAARLADAEGVTAITMTGIAEELGSATMSLYRYVESREDLVVLTADRALGPGYALDGDTWDDRLRAWVRDLRAAYERHPWLATLPVGTEPLLPSYVRRLEAGLECLGPLGLPSERAITVLTMLWTYTRGDVEQTEHLASSMDNSSNATIGQRLADRLRAVNSGHQLPRVLAALEETPLQTDQSEFEAAIDVIITGLRRTAQ